MRTFRVIVGGNEYEVAIEEITDKATIAAPTESRGTPAPKANTAPAPGKSAAAPAKAAPKVPAGDGTILAAMPGTITEVRVNTGDQVKRGDTLMILEAMKMENEIKAPIDGTVSTIEVSKGMAVNAGMALLVLA